MSRETYAEREHARHELLRECARLRHCLSSANSRVKRLRVLFRGANDLQRHAADRAAAAEAAHRQAVADLEAMRRDRAALRLQLDAADHDRALANTRIIYAEARACARRCPLRRRET